MKLSEIKKEMEAFTDFWGGDLISVSKVRDAKTKEELSEIIDEHRIFLEEAAIDAQSHLENFRRSLGLD